MSQYVILVETAPIISVTGIRCALSTSNNPAVGLQTLQQFCPISLQLIHSIPSASRTDYLLKTLQIKFQKQHYQSFWYDFTDEHIAFIKTINAENLSKVVGLIHRAECKPELNGQEVSSLIAEGLKKAQEALR